MLVGAGILTVGTGPATAVDDDGDPGACEAGVAGVACQLLGMESLEEFIEDTIEQSAPPEGTEGVDGPGQESWVVHHPDGSTSHHSKRTVVDPHGGTCLYHEVIHKRDGVEVGRSNSVQCTSIGTGTA